ncbi:MAG: efflux RND transporter periplasmic adaptor subunit [Gammaproteobacteria bacterium]|nr:efflux RND transporter periplasmic adaptor subunit [Gammaproteobacteria bacterium]
MNIPSLAIKVFLTLLILTLAVVAAAGIIMTRPMPEPVAIAPNVVAIRGIQMEAENIPLTIYAQGVVEPLTASELITQVNGRVAWVSPNFNAGGFFKQGEPLVKLESEDYEARVGLAEAREVRALAEFEHATFELKRMRALVKDQLVSQAMLENAVRQTRLTEAALKEAQINLDQAERDLDRTELRAPFDAIVRSKAVDLGEFVSMGKPLAQLFAADGFEVRLPVLDTQLAYLNLPSSIEATAPLNSTNLPSVRLSAQYAGAAASWDAQLVRSESEIDRRSRMVTLVARVSGTRNALSANPLPVGAFVNAEIEGITLENAFQLPRSALRQDNQVLVIDEESRLRFREVSIARYEQDRILIQSGLKEGDIVNISPIQAVVDGMEVSVTETPREQVL